MLRELLRGEGLATGRAHVITQTKRIGTRPSTGGRPHSSLAPPLMAQRSLETGLVVRAPRLGAGLLPLSQKGRPPPTKGYKTVVTAFTSAANAGNSLGSNRINRSRHGRKYDRP